MQLTERQALLVQAWILLLVTLESLKFVQRLCHWASRASWHQNVDVTFYGVCMPIIVAFACPALGDCFLVAAVFCRCRELKSSHRGLGSSWHALRVPCDFPLNSLVIVLANFPNCPQKLFLDSHRLIEQVSLVINYDLPTQPENYLHRIGVVDALDERELPSTSSPRRTRECCRTCRSSTTPLSRSSQQHC